MGRWRHGIPVFMYRRVCLRSIHSFEVCGLGALWSRGGATAGFQGAAMARRICIKGKVGECLMQGYRTFAHDLGILKLCVSSKF